jgi:hypothetical protein
MEASTKAWPQARQETPLIGSVRDTPAPRGNASLTQGDATLAQRPRDLPPGAGTLRVGSATTSRHGSERAGADHRPVKFSQTAQL